MQDLGARHSNLEARPFPHDEVRPSTVAHRLLRRRSIRRCEVESIEVVRNARPEAREYSEVERHNELFFRRSKYL